MSGNLFFTVSTNFFKFFASSFTFSSFKVSFDFDSAPWSCLFSSSTHDAISISNCIASFIASGPADNTSAILSAKLPFCSSRSPLI